MLRKRLYLQIYIMIIASLVLIVILSGLLWSALDHERFFAEPGEPVGRIVQMLLPPADAPAADQREAIGRIGQALGFPVTLFDRDLSPVASYGRPLPSPEGPARRDHGWTRMGRHFHWTLRLPDGRWIVADPGGGHFGNPLLRFLLFLGTVAVAVAIAAYPFVRRLTRRLERLQRGVDRIGEGDLAARVEVEGRDEIAGLAQRFNLAAERIEKLVGAQRMLLAHASHELRTPLARIRLGIEMSGATAERMDALRADIAELESLVDEILLMSRLDTVQRADRTQPVDLLALAAEECARYPQCRVSGRAGDVFGDAHLLRRLIRNLLENAKVHGKPPVSIDIREEGARLSLTVSDAGPGIDEKDRERVFQPFYRAPDRQNVRGYGLGLALVRQIAQAHGGTASVGGPRGAAIRVELDARPPREQAAEAGP